MKIARKKRFVVHFRRSMAVIVGVAVGVVVMLEVALGMLEVAVGIPSGVRSGSLLHYAPNGNFGANGEYRPSEAGFNLADISSAGQLASLPPAVKGLVWVGACNGADETFITMVRPFVNNPKVFGFYLMDDPDPRQSLFAPRASSVCSAEHLRAESDWIHANVAGAKVFIVLMNMGSSKLPSFENTYNPFNSHVDLFGISPYPCRTELPICDYAMINHYVSAALSAGIPQESIVPIYQTFGGGDWVDDGGGHYRMPTVSEEREILRHWAKVIRMPTFDYAYSWASQKQDMSLAISNELRALFTNYNNISSTASYDKAQR
jgi:hypothetical protein